MKRIFVIFLILIIPFNTAFSQEIPNWIKDNAKWWADGDISDQTFVTGIEFLINNKIIQITQTDVSSEKLNKIPEWVKQNAKWWYEGQINDETFLQGLEFLIKAGIISVSIPNDEIVQYPGYSPLFDKFAYKKDIINVDDKAVIIEIHLELKPNMQEKYSEIGFFDGKSDAIVIQPMLTSTAYWEPGFYNYYRGECGEECLTKQIEFDRPLGFAGSDHGFKVLEILNYDTISDYELAKNPAIIDQYDKVIVLHNEYVTKKVFDAINNHSKVIYLYPNALYAEIDINFEKDTISLIRGHGYPESEIANGFGWAFDNTHPYESDTECNDWEFYEISNGVMLNCYPENIIYTDFEILKAIKNY